MSAPLQFEASGEWAQELSELQLRRSQARAMGGPEALAKFKASGRLNARERIAQLLDVDTFRELGSLAGKGHYSREGVWMTSRYAPAPRKRRLPTSGFTSNAWRTSCACR